MLSPRGEDAVRLPQVAPAETKTTKYGKIIRMHGKRLVGEIGR
jgi:hypothetical protein